MEAKDPASTPRRPRRQTRGIFTKLVTVFLVIGLIPFLGISFWTYHKAKFGMTETVIEYWLVRLAREVAVHLDDEVRGLHALVRTWSTDEVLAADFEALGDGPLDAADTTTLLGMGDFLRHRHETSRQTDLLLLVRHDGVILAGSLPPDSPALKRMLGKRVSELLGSTGEEESAWIAQALRPTDDPETLVTLDCHVSSLRRIARDEAEPETSDGRPPRDPAAYSVGLARTILGTASNGNGGSRRPVRGALVALFNWTRIHDHIDAVTDRFQGAPDWHDGEAKRWSEIAVKYDSGYPFLFAADRESIIGHRYKHLIGNSLVADHNLPGFRDAMGEALFGYYTYEYPRGTPKISGFAHTLPVRKGGFGWVIGVGINDTQIYKDVRELRDFMAIAALMVTGMVILLAAIFSHRITEPITRLIRHTERIARGDLDTRIHIDTKDEIAVLAQSFNQMTEDLQATNDRLIQAEKDAAWREMARQVAHEIKNPLTPIMLSAQQVQQAHRDHHEQFDRILADAMGHVIDQCESLKRIASDFATFAAFPTRSLEPEDLRALVENTVALYRPAQESGITITCEVTTPPDTKLVCDKDEINRVFLNIFNNALEAMQEDGKLTVTVAPTTLGDRPAAEIQIADTGRGIPFEDRPRLFEPYFSTRTGGTGLGLAICKKIVTEHGGTISCESIEDQGTTFTIVLPLEPPARRA